MMNNLKKWSVLVSVLVLASCQQAEDLKTSVENRWKNIIEENFEPAYDYYSPGYKEIESLEAFKLRILTAQINLRWKKAEYMSAECEDETVCKVRVRIDYSYNFAKRSLGNVDVKTDLTENWIKLNDKWNFVPENK